MKLQIKEFAELTGVSVRTLHYYDEIGLLKPSYVDEQNGYAVHQEIISRMMAEHYGYSYTDVHDMMWEACKNVRRLRGKVPLEQILAGYYTKNQIETVLPTEDEEDF